ncbi:hypothetical protein CH300_20240 [Rhodococcus sp. 15-1154-1]|nr:hypothetical protein CH300_20240 [Rhodococcus sp. 15-1154-1]
MTDWIGGLVMDGLDPNDLPDDVDLTGTAKFEPELTDTSGGIRVPNLPRWFSVQAVTVSYANGRLTHRGLPYVMLLAPNAELNPTNWKWKVSFDLRLNGSQINRKTFSFVLPVFDPAAPLVDGRNPTAVDLTIVQPVNVPGSGTGVVQGPRGFSIRGVEVLDDGIQFLGETLGGDLVPVGDPVPLPTTGDVPDDSIGPAKLEPSVRQTLAEIPDKATLTEDPARPGLYFFSSAAATDGVLATASPVYKAAAKAASTAALRLMVLSDSTSDSFVGGGVNGGSTRWADTWPNRLARKLRAQLSLPAGGVGWIPPSPPTWPGGYDYDTAIRRPANYTEMDELNFQIGIPGSLWLQQGHGTNVYDVEYPLSPGTTSVDLVTTGYGGLIQVTCANSAANTTFDSAGDRKVTRITNPGAWVRLVGAASPAPVGFALLGIYEHVGDETAGVRMLNLAQAAIQAAEVHSWLQNPAFSTKPMIGSYAPDVCLVVLGSNDLSSGGKTPQQAMESMGGVALEVKSVAPDCEVVFVMRPNPAPEFSALTNLIVANAPSIGAYALDVRTDPRIALTVPGLYVSDGVHFSAAGDEAMADLMLDYMKVGV